jgi:periplasmic protein TonB
MLFDFDENRPDTPRVPAALTRLERLLLVVVGYQFLLLTYFIAPDSWFVKPVKQLISPEEPMRFVEIKPLVDRSALAKLSEAPSAANRRAPPTPAPAPPAPQTSPSPPSTSNVPAPPAPRAADAARPVTGASANEAPPAPRVPGGILGNALRGLNRYAQEPGAESQEGGVAENGPSIQFDPKGVDFGPWLRRFRAQVYRNWLIPEVADVMHGHVVIQMVILRSGAILNPHIVQSSGIAAFDSAAMTALKLSSPTMRLPDTYPGDAIDPFTVIFYYNEQIH